MTDPLLGEAVPLVPPLYQSSVYNLPDIDALDRIYNGEATGFIYARDGHPNAKTLADQLAVWERAQWGLVTGSGMGALAAAFLGYVSAGERIIASNRLYGRTTKLLRQEMARFQVKTSVVDCNDLAAVEQAFAEPARVLFVETMSNPMLRTVDIPALAEIAHKHHAKLVVDNTFATPVLYRPLEHGADLVMESLTKMIGGHSDVTLGALCGNDVDLLPALTAIVSTWGLAANPFDCWVCERGLGTLSLRMRAATANALALAEWLPQQAGMVRVIYPSRGDHPDQAIAQRLMPEGCGNMMCFELADRDAVNVFMRRNGAIPFSPSLGHVTTTLSHPDTTSHRYDSPAEKKRQGITPGLVRLSVGCEALDVIQAAFRRGLGIG